MILVGPTLYCFQFYCVSSTFGIIIIGPKTDRCKLGLFCLEAMEACTVQETTDKGSIILPEDRKKKLKASIIYTSGGTLPRFWSPSVYYSYQLLPEDS